jgi:glycosyltransferase involved in cell wall biosynthesis
MEVAGKDYRVRPGYSMQMPFGVLLCGGDLLESPSPETVRLNAWKLEEVPSPNVAPALALAPFHHPVSIIIPAWKAAEFLQECLDSLSAQSHFARGAEFEILLGIDACKATRRRALKIAKNYPGLKVFWFDPNQGPYVLKNSLAALARHDRLLFFDADDTAAPDMLECLLQEETDRSAVYMQGQDSNGGVKQTCGVFLIQKALFLEIGGFMPWRCAADTEFIKRLERAKINKVTPKDRILMHRRVHENQITQKPDTGFGSVMRAGYMRLIRQMEHSGLVNAGLVTVPYEELA